MFWGNQRWWRATSCLAALSLLACGGIGSRSDQATGGAPSNPPGSCHDGETVHPDGSGFPAGDGCNICGCNHGQLVCTLVDCAIGCSYDGQAYQPGDSFPATDGCNSCGCEENGNVLCTERGCDTCESVLTQYEALRARVKKCEPGAPDACGKRVGTGLTCGCETHVNAAAWDQATADALAQAYAAAACGERVNCGECLIPVSAHCSDDGECVDDYESNTGPACRVNGVVYPDGAAKVPDPSSCNTCQCNAGQLVCTEINCPVACPTGSAFGRGCAQCGPTDACLVVDYGCMPVCAGNAADTCADFGYCDHGVCIQTCG